MMRVPTQAKPQAFMDVVNQLTALGFVVKPTCRREESIFSNDPTLIPLGKLFQEDDGQPYIRYQFPLSFDVRYTDMDALLRHLAVASKVFAGRDDASWLYAILVGWFPELQLVRGQVRLHDMRIVVCPFPNDGYCVNAYGQTYVFRDLAELRVNLRRGMDTAFTTYAG